MDMFLSFNRIHISVITTEPIEVSNVEKLRMSLRMVLGYFISIFEFWEVFFSVPFVPFEDRVPRC